MARRPLDFSRAIYLCLPNTVVTETRFETRKNRETKAAVLKPYESSVAYQLHPFGVMAPPKVYALTKENLELLQRSLGPQEPWALRVLLEEQIHCGDARQAHAATPSASYTMPTISASSVLTLTLDVDECLELYSQLPTSGNDHPIERFLTPGASFEPLWFAKRELAALQMPYGDMASLEKRILLGKRNYSDVKLSSRERKWI